MTVLILVTLLRARVPFFHSSFLLVMQSATTVLLATLLLALLYVALHLEAFLIETPQGGVIYSGVHYTTIGDIIQRHTEASDI